MAHVNIPFIKIDEDWGIKDVKRTSPEHLEKGYFEYSGNLYHKGVYVKPVMIEAKNIPHLRRIASLKSFTGKSIGFYASFKKKELVKMLLHKGY